MPAKSSSSVVIRSADRKAIRTAVESYIEELRQNHPEVERVIWFGSWARGLPLPRSDVDVCLIISSSSERPCNRVSKYLPSRFPTGVDLVVYTQAEFERLQEELPQWHAAIISGLEFKLRAE